MDKVVLLTGGTGFLGTNIAKKILADTDAELTALVRAPDTESALIRLRRSWYEHPELKTQIGKRVRIETGDLGKRNFGRPAEEFTAISEHITHIVHCAADLRLDAPLEEMRTMNVGSTAMLLQLARNALERNGFSHFIHISTAYTAGRMNGDIHERAHHGKTGFSNTYELTKFEAERLVLDASGELPVTMVRPGMIVGDSQTGAISTFNTVYYPLRLYMTGRLRVFPANASHRLNIVPVDYVAESIIRLAFDSTPSGRIFHLTAPFDALPRVDVFMETVREWAAKHLQMTLPRLIFISLPHAVLRTAARMMKAVRPPSAKFWNSIEILAPYLNERKRFIRNNTDRVLGSYTHEWMEYLPRLLEYASYHGFMNRIPRTVHEQAASRLTSKSRPVHFSDIGVEGGQDRAAHELKNDISRACCALGKLGIRKGYRVAVMGPNSSRYLTLDIAIGLIGAVSVPLYTTTPSGDIKRILDSAGCRMICVGSMDILQRIHALLPAIPVISFSTESDQSLISDSVDWESFLESGSDGKPGVSAPVTFEDIATIRYSSGTSGIPHGSVFTHGQLVWMAQAAAQLPPWQARIHPISYLSFLPMNHVVEGILALYSPYYAPAALAIHFLEDLSAIGTALPVVRPTVFFAVPRVYEKLWHHFLSSVAGRIYQRITNPLFRAALSPVLRNGLLRRAGLDRCRMFIVGSAVTDSNLLASYRELGIEIHNAYGLTEAPLITANRYGKNRLGTVGTPLPHTEIRLDEDGHVSIRGPQVAISPHAHERQDQGGHWLETGDRGVLDDGYLILTGRVRDILVTSYGKSVQPLRVETLMKRIPGIAESRLIGEGRPFCTALLWAEKDIPDRDAIGRIDTMMTELRNHVSAPERPRRWAVLPNNLSIEDGTLTPNYKIKRDAVLEAYAPVIQAMYGDMALPGSVLHMGSVEKQA